MASRTNNPFAPSPQSSLQATASKYPDISSDPALAQNQPQQQQQYAPQQQYQQQATYQQPQQTGYQQASYQQPQQTGYGGPSSSSFAPQPQSYSPAPYQQQQYYPQQQQQFFSVSDLDPYANLGSLQQSGAGGAGGASGSGSRPLPAALAGTQQTQTHPRQFVMDNKQQLMGWDEYCVRSPEGGSAWRLLARRARCKS